MSGSQSSPRRSLKRLQNFDAPIQPSFDFHGFDDDNEDIVDAFCIGMAFINLICKSPSTLKSHYKQWLLNTTGLSDDWLVRSREIVCKSVQSKKS